MRWTRNGLLLLVGTLALQTRSAAAQGLPVTPVTYLDGAASTGLIALFGDHGVVLRGGSEHGLLVDLPASPSPGIEMAPWVAGLARHPAVAQLDTITGTVVLRGFPSSVGYIMRMGPYAELEGGSWIQRRVFAVELDQTVTLDELLGLFRLHDASLVGAVGGLHVLRIADPGSVSADVIRARDALEAHAAVLDLGVIDGAICNSAVHPAVRVNVVDSETSRPIEDTANVVLSDGTTERRLPPGRWSGAREILGYHDPSWYGVGVFSVFVSAPGFRPWKREGILVPPVPPCGYNTVEVEARLVRD